MSVPLKYKQHEVRNMTFNESYLQFIKNNILKVIY